MACSNYAWGMETHSGRIEHVVKTFGFITLDNMRPVAKVYFDQVSANMHGCDLTEKFSKGNKVLVNIIPNQGNRNAQYKAVHVSLSESKHHKDNPSIRGGDQYLRKYLMDHGPMRIEKLAERLSTVARNCPRFLKYGGAEDIWKVATANPDIFEIKNDILCLIDVEEDIIDDFFSYMNCYGYQIPIEAIKRIIPPDHEYRKYLHTTEQWNIGIKNFVARNADDFVFWKNSIWDKKYLKENFHFYNDFKKEMAAVKYYSKFVIQKSPLSIRSLMGHWNQASENVKDVTFPNEQEFREFLEDHSFFFILRGNQVKECIEDRLSIIDDCWLKSRRTKQRGNGGRGKANYSENVHFPQRQNQFVPHSTATSARPKETVRQADSWSPFKKPMKMPIPCSSEVVSPSTSRASHYGFQTAAPAPPLLFQDRGSCDSNKRDIFGSNEAKIFKQLVGHAISNKIENELLANGRDLTLNSLLLLRMNVGKPPFVKFRIQGEKRSFNCSLKTGSVKTEDMQKILRQNAVVKLDTSCHYGVKGTLHSIRTLEQNGEVTGLTLFCQLHEDNDGLALDILKKKKFTAVFTGNYPTKYIYNYLRCRCNELSRREDVLVLDVDGQLSGFDEQVHSSLGTASRILCSSSSELVEKISNAVQHMHEYVVISGIDSVEQLQPIQKMCSRGTRVFAEVSSDLKSEVESMFP